MHWTSSLWARDADTGEVKWVYQLTPNNTWNFSGENDSILIDQSINGVQRRTLMHFDSNGFVYTLDRATGELLLAEKYKENTNWASHIDLKTGRPQVVKQYKANFDTVPTMRFKENYEMGEIENVCPFAGGGYSSNIVHPAAYSPKNDLFYIASGHLCMALNISKMPLSSAVNNESISTEWNDFMTKISRILPNDYTFYTSFPTGTYSAEVNTSVTRGYFEAWEPKEQRVKWRIDDLFPVDSGPVVTAGNIVFYGTKYGYFNALNAETGDLVYQFKSPASIVGNISIWQYDGIQYVGFYTSSLGQNSPTTNTNSGTGTNLCGTSGGYPIKDFLKQVDDIYAQIDNETKGTFMVFHLKINLKE